MRSSDFRSDTVTRPSAAMRAAMAEADVGDDVLDGDPSVRRLEERAAEWLGKDGALFVPSGTMANQVALGVWLQPGDEVVLGRDSHIHRYEAGALAALHGAQALSLQGDRGLLSVDAVREALRPQYVHCPRTGLICVEQTHMGAGGRVLPHDELAGVYELAQDAGIPVHMDGARLANAVVASGRPAKEWAACSNSVSLCFSKGLGAPVGSVIAGDSSFCERALVVRKRLGGWMRQAGVLAAPALLALEENLKLLSRDHLLAGRVAAALDRIPGISCPAAGIETNIVIAQVALPDMDAVALAGALDALGVRAMPLGGESLRFVTHRDVGEEDLARLEQALEALLVSAP